MPDTRSRSSGKRINRDDHHHTILLVPVSLSTARKFQGIDYAFLSESHGNGANFDGSGTRRAEKGGEKRTNSRGVITLRKYAIGGIGGADSLSVPERRDEDYEVTDTTVSADCK